MFEPIDPPPIDKRFTGLIAVWCSLVPIWLVMSLAAGGFRTTVGGNLFVASWASYPVLIVVAFGFQRVKPSLALLPALSIAAMFISGAVDNLLKHH